MCAMFCPPNHHLNIWDWNLCLQFRVRPGTSFLNVCDWFLGWGWGIRNLFNIREQHINIANIFDYKEINVWNSFYEQVGTKKTTFSSNFPSCQQDIFKVKWYGARLRLRVCGSIPHKDLTNRLISLVINVFFIYLTCNKKLFLTKIRFFTWSICFKQVNKSIAWNVFSNNSVVYNG